MVRHGQIEAEQRKHAARKPFRLSQGKAEHEPQAEYQLDCKVRVARLAARRAAMWGLPSSQRCFVYPEGDVTPPKQSRLVSRPVRDSVAGPGNAMTVRGVVFERHERNMPARSGSGYPGIPALRPMPCRSSPARSASTHAKLRKSRLVGSGSGDASEHQLWHVNLRRKSTSL